MTPSVSCLQELFLPRQYGCWPPLSGKLVQISLPTMGKLFFWWYLSNWGPNYAKTQVYLTDTVTTWHWFCRKSFLSDQNCCNCCNLYFSFKGVRWGRKTSCHCFLCISCKYNTSYQRIELSFKKNLETQYLKMLLVYWARRSTFDKARSWIRPRIYFNVTRDMTGPCC